jgi:hypothetical protein
MQPGDISDPVRTEVGFHVIQCTEHLPVQATPLKYCYANVGLSLATQVSREQGRLRADSLRRSIHSLAEARRLTLDPRFGVAHDAVVPGELTVASDLRPFFRKLEALPVGTIHPEVAFYSGSGWAIAWVDSVAPAREGTWEQARDRALQTYRSEAGDRSLRAKVAELDSMGRAGWSLDSLAGLWGGLETYDFQAPGLALPKLGGAAITDSLVFGVSLKPPALGIADASGWVDLPGGACRVRLVARKEPPQVQVDTRVGADLQAGLERNLRREYERLMATYPVRILDRELAETPLPEAVEP